MTRLEFIFASIFIVAATLGMAAAENAIQFERLV